MTQEPHPETKHRVDPGGAADHAPEAVQSLKQAMRRARFDDAERVGVLAELRAMQVGRLELLQEALRPLLAQIPADVDLFDVGLMPGATPRLFIDMIGFVEMGRDARVYRLLQDTRHTRVTIEESTDIARMVDAITDYVARRLLERDKALAAEMVAAGTSARAPATPAAKARAASVSTEPPADTPQSASTASSPDTDHPPSRGRLARAAHLGTLAFAFIIDLLGATVFFAILAFGIWLAWNKARGQI